jgi:hypothetical protein
MNIKKILYNGGFATLGVGLLVGMAVLQANGRKSSEDVLAQGDSLTSSQPETFDMSSNTAPVNQVSSVTPADPSRNTLAPMPVTAAAQPVLKNIRSFSIFDSANKAGTKKGFAVTRNNLRAAKAYYKKLSGSATVVIKAETKPGKFQTVTPEEFSQYIASHIGG